MTLTSTGESQVEFLLRGRGGSENNFSSSDTYKHPEKQFASEVPDYAIYKRASYCFNTLQKY